MVVDGTHAVASSSAGATPHDDALTSAGFTLDDFALGDGNLWLLSVNEEEYEKKTTSWRMQGLCPPTAAGRKLAVLDLDNTLIHTCTPRGPPVGEDMIDLTDQPSLLGKGRVTTRVEARPHAVAMLRSLHGVCDVVVFTASTRECAQDKVAWLELRVGRPFGTVLYRDDTLKIESTGTFVKDITLFIDPPSAASTSEAPRTLADIVLVEDCVFAGAPCPENVIPISHWRGESTDRAMPALGRLLRWLLAPNAPDVRPRIRHLFDLQRRMQAARAGPGCAALRRADDGTHGRRVPPPLLQSSLLPGASRPTGCTCVFQSEHVILAAALCRHTMAISPPGEVTAVGGRKRRAQEVHVEDDGTAGGPDARTDTPKPISKMMSVSQLDGDGIDVD